MLRDCSGRSETDVSGWTCGPIFERSTTLRTGAEAKGTDGRKNNHVICEWPEEAAREDHSGDDRSADEERQTTGDGHANVGLDRGRFPTLDRLPKPVLEGVVEPGRHDVEAPFDGVEQDVERPDELVELALRRPRRITAGHHPREACSDRAEDEGHVADEVDDDPETHDGSEAIRDDERDVRH